MKRSTINAVIEDAAAFFKEQNFYLPPYAFWTADDWCGKGAEVEEIVKNGLGWDVTDYGLDDFMRYGLLLFTLRNGNITDWEAGRGKPYAEKVMIAEVGQEHQMHFHGHKMEDFINRAGGVLAIQLYNATPDNQLDDTEVTVMVDGVVRTMPAGSIVALKPGESITLPTRLYHKFWAERSRVMIGEVSMINDDRTDNYFYQPLGNGRFPVLEEDEAPRYLLHTDYENYWGRG